MWYNTSQNGSAYLNQEGKVLTLALQIYVKIVRMAQSTQNIKLSKSCQTTCHYDYFMVVTQ